MPSVGYDKVDNNRSGEQAKITLRQNVLDMVKPAHVFDVFCGIDGVMWRHVWHKAASYAGCDLKWKITDTRTRYVGDSLRVMRCIDLTPFNVFDVDAYGDPFEALYIIGQRRTWQAGEVGAVVLTDAAGMFTQFGHSTRGTRALIGLSGPLAPTREAAEALHRLALRKWTESQGLKPLRFWHSCSTRAKGPGNKVRYSAIVFHKGES